jgi:hypothetical protein
MLCDAIPALLTPAFPMKRASCRLPAVVLFGVLTLSGLCPSAYSTNIKVSMTVDNSYALYYGTAIAATNFVGTDGNWPSVETYTFNLPSSYYMYVVTQSDVAVAQGFLGQFENLDSGYKFYSNDPQWQVMATGLGNNSAPYGGTAVDLALLTNEILDANGGGNPSNGWVATTGGPSNGSGPWGLMPNIDSAAQWVWYSSNGDPDPTSPGFNHDEWLVFRVALAATPDNPVPSVPDGGSTVGLVAVSLLGLGLLRRRSQAE